jgi:D-3-phosphoglycerate dehydrogenase
LHKISLKSIVEMRVLFLDVVHEVLWQRLTQAGYTCEADYTCTFEELCAKIGNYQGVVIRSRLPLQADFFAHASNLRFIARSGSGLENIDIIIAEKKSVQVFSAPEGNRDAVGEHALGMLLALFNKLLFCHQEVSRGIWQRKANQGVELKGKTVGIIGYGNTGSAFAEKLQGFGVQILAYDKYKTGFSTQYVQEVGLAAIFSQADVVSLHLPLHQDTHYFADKTFFASFQKPIYFINTSRGACLQTHALLEALSLGRVLGACLDVFEFEDLSFQLDAKHALLEKLASQNNVLLSPHVAGWTDESYYKLSAVLADKILNYFA